MTSAKHITRAIAGIARVGEDGTIWAMNANWDYDDLKAWAREERGDGYRLYDRPEDPCYIDSEGNLLTRGEAVAILGPHYQI